jgi:hypothetical protein
VAAQPTPERPRFASGYGTPTDDEGLLPWAWASERLAAAHNYWLATTRPDGRPHAQPIWALWYDPELWFSTDPKSVKGRNLAGRPDAVVHLESGDETVILEGRATRAADLHPAFVEDYERKYGWRVDPLGEDTAYYSFRPATVLAWREADFPQSVTRFKV